MKVLSKKDWGALAVLASAWASFEESSELIAKYGVVVERKNKKGYVQLFKNPAVSVRKEAWAMIVKVSSEFGLTPASMQRVRESVNSTPEEPEDGKESSESFLFGSRRTVAGGGKVLPLKRG